MKIFKKFLAVALMLVMVTTATPLSGFVGLDLPKLDLNIRASASGSTGQCGDDVYWSYDSENKKLVIYGNGPMYDYAFEKTPFYRCDAEYLTVSDGVTVIGECAFYHCINLKSVDLPESLTTISEGAFYNCEKIKEFIIPYSVISVESHAFGSCDDLQNITLGDNVESVGYSAFDECSSLESIVIYNKNCEIYDSANTIDSSTVIFGHKNSTAEAYATEYDRTFKLIEDLHSHEYVLDYSVAASCGKDGYNVYLCACGDKKTETIAALEHNWVYFPDKSKSPICYDDGYNYYLCSVCWAEYYETVAQFGKHTDDDKNDICDICGSYGDDVSSAGYCGDNARYVLYKDGRLIISGTGIMRDYAFYNRTDIKSVKIEDGITEIGEYAFYQCSEIKDISLSEGLKLIDNYAFARCGKLTKINIPDSVTEIGADVMALTAWYHTLSAGEAILDNWILGYKGTNNDFYKITINSDIKGISNSVIRDWYLNSIELDAKNKHFVLKDGILFNSDMSVLIRCPRSVNSNNYIVPDSVKTIGPCAFHGAQSVTRVVLPENLISIGDNAFTNSALDQITIPLSLKKFENSALYTVEKVFYAGSIDNWNAIENHDIALDGSTDLFLNHTHSYTAEETKRKDCQSYGKIVYTCVYGDSYSLELPPNDHIWDDEYTIGVDPTCHSQGYKYIKCLNCDVKKDYTYYFSEHSWSDWKTIAADCATGAKGYDFRTCDVCGNIETQNTYYPEHAWSEWVIVTEPSCDKEGVETRTCSNCKLEENQSIPSLGWHNTVILEGKDPSCTTPGLTFGTKCSKCNTILEAQIEIEAIGHTYTDEPSLTPATVDKDGEYGYFCEVCYETLDSVKIPKIDKDTIKLSQTEYYSNGKVRTPSVNIKDIDGNKLIKGEDYNLIYDSGRKNPGEYNVTVEFKGNYEGSYTLSFVIIGVDSIDDLTVDSNYTSLDINWTDVDGADVYEVYKYVNGSAVLVDTTTESNYKLKDLKPNTKYKIQVRAGKDIGDGEYIWGSKYTATAYTTNYPTCDHVDNNSDRICEICGEEALMFAGNYGGTVFRLYIDGTFVISGTGEAYCRWVNYREFIKRVIVEEGITYLGTGCFAVCTNLESVSLPSTLEYIADEVFYSCEKLESISIPDTVYGFGNRVFSGCISLSSLTIPEGVTELRYYFASGCTALTEVNLPSTIVELGDGAFAGCTALDTIKLPDGLKRIYGAFKYCSALKEIQLPDGIESIGYEAFKDCDSLTDITFPESLVEIEGTSFDDCDGFTEIYIPSTVKNVGYAAFYNCDSLKKAIIGAEYLYDYVFVECDNLTEVEFIDGAKSVGWSIFEGCKNLKTVKFSNTIELIEGYAFANCTSLAEVTLPISLEYLGGHAFYRCHNLKKVDLANVSEIGYSAFEDCIRLEEVEISVSTSHIYENAFKNCIRLGKITVFNPDCIIESYRDTFPENAIIYGYDYSTAEKYADDWLRAFNNIGGEHVHRYIGSVTTQATCLADGVKTYACPCGDSYTEAVAALGHFAVEFGGKVATCTEAGKTAGSKCKRCNVVLVEETIIPATGHNMVKDVANSYGATCTTNGAITVSCTHCGYAEVTPIYAAGHNMIADAANSYGATCTTNGALTVICTNCYYVETTAIYATGHTMNGGACVTCGYSETVNCTCNCHKSGVSNLLFKLILIFQRLLRTNKNCTCGAVHY